MNAKQEFISHVDDRKVKCASISGREHYNRHNDSWDSSNFDLRLDYSPSEFQEFLNLLDFNYDNGYGGQELHGTIWYDDGTWSSRGEYDGSEWWEYNKCPDIDENCKR